MTRNQTVALAGSAVVLLAAGIWLNVHRSNQQEVNAGGRVFADLTPALADVSEIRLSKGDGSHATLRKEAAGWTVAERQYPADTTRVRELLLGLNDMKVVELKTSDPANYAKLGVDDTASPTAAGTLVEVVAGAKSWALIVGKNAEGRAIYVRKPKEATSALVEPAITVDPDQKRWLDRDFTDVPGAEVHDISVKPASGPAYLLTRAKKGDADLVLSPVPAGRKPANNMVINGQADTLAGFHFDDVRAAPAAAPASVDHTTIRTFDGKVFEFTGHRDGDKAYVSVNASTDAALATQFAEPAKPAAATPATAAATPAPSGAPTPTPAAKPADQAVERLSAHKGLEYEIPLYKYESLFKPLEDLLEKKPEPPPKPQKESAGKASPAKASPVKAVPKTPALPQSK